MTIQYKLISMGNSYSIISNEEIKESDYYIAWETNYATNPKERWVIYNLGVGLNGINQQKIIASQILSLNLSNITFSEEVSKELGIVDLHKIGCDMALKSGYHTNTPEKKEKFYNGIEDYLDGVKNGYEQAILNNQHKQFTLEDIKEAVDIGLSISTMTKEPFTSKKFKVYKQLGIDTLLLVLAKKEYIVELEMDKIPADRAPNGWEVFPKIVNNFINVIKIIKS
jgi:hypothetical protein